MALNVGYLTCDRTSSGDEVYTPYYAVDPILEFIPKDKTIWCPFDEEWSAFVRKFQERGNKVIYSHLNKGKDFFEYEPEEYDIIVSNPAFSIKDKVLKRLYELNKPFAILLPANSIQGKKRFEIFHKDIQMLCFDVRVDYHTNGNMITYTKGNHFGSAYFCRSLLPERLVMRKLEKYNQFLWKYTVVNNIKFSINKEYDGEKLSIKQNCSIVLIVENEEVLCGIVGEYDKDECGNIIFKDFLIYDEYFALFNKSVYSHTKFSGNKNVEIEQIFFKLEGLI